MSHNVQYFSHSGDIGDIIYSLPTIRAAGGGVLRLFHLPGRTAHGMNEAKVNRLRPLLIQQDYISDVVWSPNGPDHNLNGFRDHWNAGNLSDQHLSTHGLGWEHRAKAWIRVDSIRQEWPVIVSRSPRYHNPRFPWPQIVSKYEGKIGFIGFPEEHREFCGAFGEIPFADASNFLEIARLIAGAQLFIGNFSSPHAVAHGLKANMIQEMCPHNPGACTFRRMNCIDGYDERIELPEVN